MSELQNSKNGKNSLIKKNIKNCIYNIRGMQVMIDEELAQMYEVTVKRLNEQVKRNIDRFPEKFRFQLTTDEYESLRLQISESNKNHLRSQNATLNNNNLKSQSVTLKNGRGKHRKYLPYVFTEQGVAMLSAVLRSETAVKVSIQIMDAFVEMRKFLINNALVFQRLDKVELKQIETDKKIDEIFNAIQSKELAPKQGIFFNGQIFDAYTFVSDLIRSAKKSIILIDNYIDDTVLTLFAKRKKSVKATIFTKKISKQLSLDIDKFNSQYEPIEVKIFKDAHDRFLILDEKEVYHFGASLKDLGKKWFAFSKMDVSSLKVLDKVQQLIMDN